MATIEEFEQLLESLQSLDNEVRKTAESHYEGIDANSKFSLLMTIISNTDKDLKHRIFSGVLCRRLLDVEYETAFEKLDKRYQQEIQGRILQLIINETNKTIRKKLSDITAEIAKRQFDTDGNFQWRELLDFIFNICISSSNEDLKITGLNLFSVLPNILSANRQENINIVGNTLSKCLGPTDESGNKQSIFVREAAVKTLTGFVASEYEDNTHLINQLRSLVPALLQTIHDSIQENPCDDSVMKSFVELVDDASGFLKTSVPSILELCTSILQNQENETIQKHLAIEAFVSLSESCTNTVRKNNNFSHAIIQYLFNMLTDIEDDPNWAFIDEDDNEDDSSAFIIAEIALDRLAVAMKGKRLLEEIKQTVPGMLHSNNWKYRHGGLKAISSMGEGLQKLMSEILGSIVDEVVRLLNDEHPRVRYAACVCIGQMSTDFDPKLQNLYHDKIIPNLIRVLDDTTNPRVQAYACSALTNFCEGASKEILSIYLQMLMEKLVQVLNNQCSVLVNERKKLVLEQVVTTVAAVSETTGNKFDPYYPSIIPIIKWIMQNCNSDDLRTLRGKSIECISLMGLAVGKEKFLNDAQDVMNMLVGQQTQQTELSPDDPQHSYMISAWARICKMMGKEFAPYLQYVMPSVLKTANNKPETCFMYDEETEEVSKDWQVVKVGQDQNVAINTSGIEDKMNACQMLICYARELKEAFAPYVRDVANIMLPLLNFYLNDDIRSAAADIIPCLLECSKPLGEEVRHQLWQEMLTALLSSLQDEEEKNPQGDMLNAISEGLEAINTRLCDDDMAKLFGLLRKFFEEVLKAQDARNAARRADDYEEDEEGEDLEEAREEDEALLSRLVGVTHALFRVYGCDSIPLYNELSPFVLKLLGVNNDGSLNAINSKSPSELQYGLCILDSVLEFTGENSWSVIGPLMPLFNAGLRHTAPEVRQAAAYGYGLIAQNCCGSSSEASQQFQNILREGSPILLDIINHPNSRSTENNVATENAISALTKIAINQTHCLPTGLGDRFVPLWLSWLPVWEDEEETQYVYGYLCDLMEQNHPAATSQQGLATVLKAIATVVNKEALEATNSVYERCIRLVNLLFQSNEPLFNQCVQNLSDDEKYSLNKALLKARI